MGSDELACSNHKDYLLGGHRVRLVLQALVLSQLQRTAAMSPKF